jgi:uncharacterized protein (TIGR03437 family)
MHQLRPVALAAVFSVLVLPAVYAQQSRLTSPIDNTRLSTLRGHVRPAANAANDAGPVEDSFSLPAITLLLKPSAAQRTELEQLLADQQNPASRGFRRWLTPEQYAARFGSSDADVARIRAWAESQGLRMTNLGRSRTFLSFSATARQVQTAFHTRIHRYNVNGRTHFANATDPSIPAALADIVAGVWGLNDFHPKPHLKMPSPQMNSAGRHFLAPDDFATIYNVAPLYSAGIDGTGQSIVIVGQSSIHSSDMQTFRNAFNLGALNLQQVLVPGSPDPGTKAGDQMESNLDLQWAGAVARNANIIFVYSTDVWQSALYAVDQNLAPILSMSYGGCEQGDLVDLPSMRSLVQHANAQGMTWFASSGDTGAAGCDDQDATIAQNGLAVNSPASIPEVTAMGGTEFDEQGVASAFWSGTNGTSSASALQYIPEIGWNDSTAGSLAATGGGASVFFPQPGWQTGPGVPNDGARHIPDLALSSSASHDGYYIVSGGSGGYVGGTSAATPTMAGIFALVNHYLASTGAQSSPGLGNVNPAIYQLAQTTTGVFHDITAGDNIVRCAAATTDCDGGSVGLRAGPGYDAVTGWGSVDAYNLARAWGNYQPLGSSVVPSIDQNPVFQQSPNAQGNSWRFTITLTEEAGVGTTLTDFTVNGVSHASQINLLFGPASIAPRGSISASYGMAGLAVPVTVVFGFSGVDANGAHWTRQLSIPFSGPRTRLSAVGYSNAATGRQSYAPGMILSVYGTAMGSVAQAAATVPLPKFLAGFEAWVNGVPAPLYYVSPGQVNIQIPYETQAGRATLTIGNPYENVDYRLNVSDTAPGIFTFADGSINPSRTARAGQEVILYVTGEGKVAPSLATGRAPAYGTPVAQLPTPQLPVSVTVGGLPAQVDFAGIPSGLVGVTQVNFTIPPDLAPGVQQVVVTVGSASSPPANITITQ